jgi:hypothetical protein
MSPIRPASGVTAGTSRADLPIEDAGAIYDWLRLGTIVDIYD